MLPAIGVTTQTARPSSTLRLAVARMTAIASRVLRHAVQARHLGRLMTTTARRRARDAARPVRTVAVSAGCRDLAVRCLRVIGMARGTRSGWSTAVRLVTFAALLVSGQR